MVWIKPTTRPYGLRCLMARRLVERGVRFVQIFMAGTAVGHAQQQHRRDTQLLRTDRPAGRRLC